MFFYLMKPKGHSDHTLQSLKYIFVDALTKFQQMFDLGCRCSNGQETLDYSLYASKPRGGTFTFTFPFGGAACDFITCFQKWLKILPLRFRLEVQRVISSRASKNGLRFCNT